MGKLRTFLATSLALGRTWPERGRIFWRLTKNLRVRLGLARHHPERVLPLETRLGTVWLRDNFGDVTNLHGLWVENVYDVSTVEGPGEVVDVGANIGLFARWIAHHNPGRRIVCFEPLAGNASVIPRNCPQAVVAGYGLGRQEARTPVRVDDHGMMATQVETAWHTSPDVIEVRPLDALAPELGIDQVALLKVDTEGMELEVLDGGADTLRRTARVVMETHSPELHRGSIERLEAAGLRVSHEAFDGHTGFVLAARA